MHLDWNLPGDDWTHREFSVMAEDGTTVEELGVDPTLADLRELERMHGERLDLWQAGLVCSACESVINGRFGSDPRGNLFCWDCAMAANAENQNGVKVNTDPTKAVLSESQLHRKSLCDYVINVATGCRHGCKFCYVPTTPAIENREEMLDDRADVDDPQEDWGSYLLYRDDLPERLRRELQRKEEWKRTERGRGVVMLSSGTDCYQDRRAAQITRGCVHELVEHDIPVRILTRSPAVVRDIDLFKESNNLVTVGSSIPSFDEALVKVIEPNAPPPRKRWEALKRLSDAGVRTYISMSPTYPMKEEEFWYLLDQFERLDPEVVFHEPINPRGQNFELLRDAAMDAGYDWLVDEFEKLQEDSYWVKYAIGQINMVQRLAENIDGLEVHSWPDRELVTATSGELREQLKAMRQAVSPEQFPDAEATVSEAQTKLATSLDAVSRMV